MINEGLGTIMVHDLIWCRGHSSGKSSGLGLGLGLGNDMTSLDSTISIRAANGVPHSRLFKISIQVIQDGRRAPTKSIFLLMHR